MHSSTETASRWSSESPLGFAAGDTNLQRYVGNSPTNYTDPTGLYAEGSFVIRYPNGDVREFGPNTSPVVIQSILENNPGAELLRVHGPTPTTVPDELAPFMQNPDPRDRPIKPKKPRREHPTIRKAYPFPSSISPEDRQELQDIVDRIFDTMQDYFDTKVKKGNGKNACWAYRDSIGFHLENGVTTPSDPKLQSDRFSLVEGGVRNWWGPPFKIISLDIGDINGISDGGIFIIDNETGKIFYAHARPNPGVPPTYFLEEYDPGYYWPVGQPSVGKNYSK